VKASQYLDQIATLIETSTANFKFSMDRVDHMGSRHYIEGAAFVVCV
jgi:hypothetical protein